MLERKTVVDQIEILPTGRVQLRLAKIIEDDGRVVASEYHRTAFDPGDDVDAVMLLVHADLAANYRQPPISADHMQQVKDHVAVAHTPHAIAKFKASKAAIGNGKP